MNRARIRLASLALAMVAILLPCQEVLLDGATFFYGDSSTHYAPQKALQAEMLRAGHAPSWNAWLQLGEPMAANPSLGVFYPPTALFFLLLSPASALSASIVTHLLLLGGGAWIFAIGQGRGRAPWTAATTAVGAALSGVALSYTTNPQYLFTLSWLPWILHYAWRAGRRGELRDALALGVCGALALHAGDPQGAVVEAMLATLVLLSAGGARPARRLLCLFGALSAALLLGAALGWPAAELLAQSRRGSGLSLAEAAEWSLHPARLSTLLLPELFGLPGPDNTFWGHPLIQGLNNTRFWFFGISVGLVPWAALALLPSARRGSGRVGLGLLAASVTLAALALGTHGALYQLAHAYLPGVAAFRYPEKYLSCAAVLVPLVAAMGCARAEQDGRGARAVALGCALVGLAAIGAAGLVLGPLADSLRLRISAWALAGNDAAALAGLRLDALRVAAHGALLLALAALSHRRPRAVFPALFLLAAAEAIPRARHLIYTTHPSFYDAPTELGTRLGTEPGGRPPRVVRDAAVLDPYPWPRNLVGEREIYGGWRRNAKPNFGLLEGIAYATGYSGLETPSARELAAALAQRPAELAGRLAAPFVITTPIPGIKRPVATDLSRGALEHVASLPRSGALLAKVVAARPAVELVEHFELGGRARMPVPGRPVAIDTTRSLVGGREVAGCPLPADLEPSPRSSAARPTERWRPDRIDVDPPPGAHGLLVLRDRFAPGWVARDQRGVELPILCVDGLLRGVWIAPEVESVEFAYQPQSLRWGVGISVTGVLLMLLMLRADPFRRARAEDR